MKKLSTLKHKIIFYVMSVAVLLAVLITLNMSIGSIVSTNTVLLENMQITTRIASQSISSNLHLLTERIYNLSSEDIFLDAAVSEEQKMARMDEMRQQVEFVWLAVYDTGGEKLYGDEGAPDSISQTGYYTYLTQTGSIVIGEPYESGGILQLCVGAAMKQEDEVTGYMVGSYKYDVLNDVLSLLILGNSGSSCILNEEGRIVGDINEANIIEQKNIYNMYTSTQNAEVFDKALSFQTGSALMRMGHVNRYVGYAPIPGTNWALLVQVPQREYMSTMVFSIGVTILLTVLLLLGAAAVIVKLSRKISDPLSAATGRLQALADGDLRQEVIRCDSNDETGILTEALAKTVASLNGYIQNIQNCLGVLAEGDYTLEIPDTFHGDFSSIHDSLCHIADALNQTMIRMNRSAGEVHENSSGVSECARQLNEGSLQQDALLKELEGSMAEIQSAIGKNRENAAQIKDFSEHAAEKTAQGSCYMQSMLDTMQQIHDAVEEISKISLMIEEISSQTNLLSLNASIEAARAGEAGRGFAVVAGEIGQLAGQTADALKQTMAMVVHSTETIQRGQEMADQTAEAFRHIEQVTDRYHGISAQMTETVAEQTAAVERITEQLVSLQEIAKANRGLAQETDQRAADSLAQSESLTEYVAQVKVKDTFREDE